MIVDAPKTEASVVTNQASTQAQPPSIRLPLPSAGRNVSSPKRKRPMPHERCTHRFLVNLVKSSSGRSLIGPV